MIIPSKFVAGQHYAGKSHIRKLHKKMGVRSNEVDLLV